VAGEPKAKVIPLHSNSGRTAAQRRAGQRVDSSRRHPSLLTDPSSRASAEQIAAVVREIDQRRGAVTAPGPDATLNEVARRVAGVAEFMRKRLIGDYTVDEFGFDPHLNNTLFLPLLRVLFKSWFRVQVTGIEHLPKKGAALVVANHAGVFDMPMLGPAARKAGHTMACTADAHRLLAAGELTAVFPEGYKGLGKHFKDRYKLQRFGRGGFVSAALRTKAPIVPCSIVGSEEIYPMIADLKLLARVLGLPYFPITPLFPLAGPVGLVPLPSKWHIQFGAPISTVDYDESAAEDPMVTFELTDQVRETIQQTLYALLTKRRNMFFG
jgi:1-acyl-sn-glycerol-3-phosphate acyltransferase